MIGYQPIRDQYFLILCVPGYKPGGVGRGVGRLPNKGLLLSRGGTRDVARLENGVVMREGERGAGFPFMAGGDI